MVAEPKLTLTIAPPHPDRPPLRANVFTTMQRGNTQLLPLFPYLHPGAMVPAGAVLRGHPDRTYGQFFHYNSVDEVVVAFATNGSLLNTGQVFVGGRVHGVNSFLRNERDPASFAVMCITQRQSEQAPQSEAIALRCAKCREEYFKREFDATPAGDAREDTHPFPTVALLPELLREFNADPRLRNCPKCGHANDPFPVAAWGWDRYAEQSATCLEARAALAKVGESRAMESP